MGESQGSGGEGGRHNLRSEKKDAPVLSVSVYV